jgi:two-component system LytT family response regulator
MKAIIIDDEAHCSATLRYELEKMGDKVDIIGEYNDPKKALSEFNSDLVELIFLDIEMPRMNGFELLKQLPAGNWSVVFTTAYDEFALKAFQYSAIDYLLKPVSGEELERAIERFHQRQVKGVRNEQLELLFSRIEGKSINRIALPSAEGLDFVVPTDIVRCESQSNYTMVHFANKRKVLVSRTLKEIEEMLVGHGFFRVHHSHLINLNNMVRYVKGSGGYLVMDDGIEVPVSRSRKESLLALFTR